MMEYASEIVNLGFAVFVAAYLLIRLDKTLNELTSAIQSFQELVKATSIRAAENIEITKEHDVVLIDHDRDVQDKLDNLERELGKVTKRNERGD